MSVKVKIQKVLLEIEIPSERDFHDISNDAMSYLNKDFSDILQTIFDELNMEKNYVIDRIEINIGVIRFDNKSELNKKIYQILKKEILLKLPFSLFDQESHLEKGIVEFIKFGKLPWWLDKKKDFNRGLSTKLFSKKFIDEIVYALSISEDKFNRLYNFFDPSSFENLIKQILEKEYFFYEKTFILIDNLYKKTKSQLKPYSFNKKKLQYFFIKKVVKREIYNNEILYNVLDMFSSQTAFPFDELITLCEKEASKKKSDFNRNLLILTKEFQKNNTQTILSSNDSLSIIVDYLRNGLENIHSEYIDINRLRVLLKLVIKQKSNNFINYLKTPSFFNSTLSIIRLNNLTNNNNDFLFGALVSNKKKKIALRILAYFNSSQFINVFKKLDKKSNFYNINTSFTKFILLNNLDKFSENKLFHDFLNYLALDLHLNFESIINDVYLTIKSGDNETKLNIYIEDLYIDKTLSKLGIQSIFDTIRINMKVDVYKENSLINWSLSRQQNLESLINKITFSQKDILNYFIGFFTSPRLLIHLKNDFKNPFEILTFLINLFLEIKIYKFESYAIKIISKSEKLFNIDSTDIIKNIIDIINIKKKPSVRDFKILSLFTREQIRLIPTDEYSKSFDSFITIYKYSYKNKYSQLHESVSTYLLKLYPILISNRSFKTKFSKVIIFEEFLSIILLLKKDSKDFSLLFDYSLSKIAIDSKTPYAELIKIVRDNIFKKRNKNYFDLQLLIKYKSLFGSIKIKEEERLNHIYLIESYNLTFLEKSFVLFFLILLKRIMINKKIKDRFKTEKGIIIFFIKNIKGELSFSDATLKILLQLVKETKTTFNQLSRFIVDSINDKKKLTSRDYEFISQYGKKDVQIELDLQKRMDIKLNYDQEQRALIFLNILITFKEDLPLKNNIKINDFLVNFIKEIEISNKNIDLINFSNLLIEKFSLITSISKQALFLMFTDKIIHNIHKSELSNTLLYYLIFNTLKQKKPNFNFPKNKSSINSIDDLIIILVNSKENYKQLFLETIYFPNVLRVLKLNTFKKVIKSISKDYEFISQYRKKDVQSELDLQKRMDVKLNYDQEQRALIFLNILITFKEDLPLKNNIKINDFLVNFIKEIEISNKNIDLINFSNLLIEKFSLITSISKQALFLMFTDKIIHNIHKSELSNTLLYYLIFNTLKQKKPNFNFPKNKSSINSIDDLIIILVNSKENYKQLFFETIYFPNVLRVLKPITFKKVIKSISKANVTKTLDFLRNLNQSTYNIDFEERLRLITIKILLKNEKEFNQKKFISLVVEDLEFHNPKYFKNNNIEEKLEEKLLNEIEFNKSTFNNILNRISEKNELFKSLIKVNSNEINQFEYLLQYKNDIFKSKNFRHNIDIKKNLESFETIISNKKSLILFLKIHKDDIDLLLAFSELGLSSKYKNQLNNTLKKVNKNILKTENYIHELQVILNLSNLKKETFFVILRTYLNQTIGRIDNISGFDNSYFIYGFLEYLSKEKYLNLRNLLNIKFIKSKIKIEKEIINIFKLFLDKGIYYGTNKKVRNNIYFKDLSKSLLNNSFVPDWIISKEFVRADAWTYLMSNIQDFTSTYIRDLFLNNPLKKEFLVKLLNQPLSFKILLIKKLQFKHIDYDLSLVFQKLSIYFSENILSSKSSLDTKFFSFFIEHQLWKSNSLIQLSDKIIFQIKKDFKISSNKLDTEIKKIIGLNQSLIKLEKIPNFSYDDKIELVKFYFEKGKIPILLNIHMDKVLKQLKTFIKDLYFEKTLLQYYLTQTNYIKNILKLITAEELFVLIKKMYFNENKLTFSIGNSLSNVFTENSTKDFKLSFYFKLIGETFLQNGIKKSSLSFFFKTILKKDKKLYTSLIHEIKNSNEIKKTDNNNLISNFLVQLIESGTNPVFEDESNLDPIELLEYYIEFGSIKNENGEYNLKSICQILETILSENQLLIKKRFHQWGKSKVRVRRVLNLYPINKRTSLLNVIHGKLERTLIVIDELIFKAYKSRLPVNLGFKNWDEVIIYCYGHWSAKNLILHTSKDLIQLFITQVTQSLNINKNTFLNLIKKDLNKNQDKDIIEELIYWTELIDIKKTKNEINSIDNNEIIDLNDNDSLFIKNAGLIILWPFLNRLFEKLNLLKEKYFLDDQAHQKAILLTEYLVTGNINFDETNLILNKLICGASLNMFVDVTIPLEKFDIDLCDSMLKGVIQNWEKLNNSSVEALRETFLIREGILKKVNSDYNLSVDNKPFDVLLSTLPWNIAMIQTSFMKNRILVEWK